VHLFGACFGPVFHLFFRANSAAIGKFSGPEQKKREIRTNKLLETGIHPHDQTLAETGQWAIR